jgi:hypothetical protein
MKSLQILAWLGGIRVQALSCIGDCLSIRVKIDMRVLIEMHEVEDPMKGMEASKALVLDMVITKSYKVYWKVIGSNYHIMILEEVRVGNLPFGVTRGLLSFVHKGGGRRQLINCLPITLFNVAYKLYAKVL